MSTPSAENLCLACGLCCNGALFKDVELQSGDNAARLKASGLSLKSRRGKTIFPQPCQALDGCACRIYNGRPTRCRQFDCALLLEVRAAKVEFSAALRTIKDARTRANRVMELLRQLGNHEEELALSLRFQRAQRQFERGTPDDQSAEVYGDLTLAVHDLNLILRDRFYPDPAD